MCTPPSGMLENQYSNSQKVELDMVRETTATFFTSKLVVTKRVHKLEINNT